MAILRCWRFIMANWCWHVRPGLPVAPAIEAAVYDLDEDAGREQPAAIAFADDPRQRRCPAPGRS
jgi:hypothetical protein